MKLPKVVTLCGSTRFKDAFTKAQLDETLAGKIVLTIGCNMRSDAEIFANLSPEELEEVKRKLDTLHMRKIDLSNEILVLNVDGYVGGSTSREIAYAYWIGREIRWLENVPEGTAKSYFDRWKDDLTFEEITNA